MLSLDRILSLKYETSMARCKGCTNHCVLTINRFDGGRQFVSGNRCERGLGKEKAKKEIPNLFDYKYHRMFDYEPLPADEAERGTIGIPRVLNMYENFPFLLKGTEIPCDPVPAVHQKDLRAGHRVHPE